jgi:hypothetical protein
MAMNASSFVFADGEDGADVWMVQCRRHEADTQAYFSREAHED